MSQAACPASGPIGLCSPDTVPAVDRFLAHEIEARALSLAMERGLIDRLARGSADATALAAAGRLPADRLDMLLGLLRSAGVVDRKGDAVSLSPAFAAVWPARDLLEAKLAFAAHAAGDLRDLFPAFVADLPDFMARSRTFELFRYDRCLEITPDNLSLTRRWVGYTTCLTRYEAGPALARLDLSAHRRLLDVGGNSGEFAAQACRRAPALRATVLDLPVVCALGRENLRDRPEADRVAFLAGDMRTGPLPRGHDLVTFKSVLHDWPEPDAAGLIARAADALAPGGRLVVFERAPLLLGSRRADYASAANLVFEPFFRPADLYRAAMARAGLRIVQDETIELETPFHLLVAAGPGGSAA